MHSFQRVFSKLNFLSCDFRNGLIMSRLVDVFSKKNIKYELQAASEDDPPPACIPVEPPRQGKFHFRCGGCGRYYRTERGFQTHLPCIGNFDLSRAKTIPCPLCGKLFQEKKDMEVHQGDVHKHH